LKTQPECLVCMFRQALNTVRVVTKDSKTHIEVLRQLARALPSMNMNLSPATIAKPVYDIVFDITGVQDPYASSKKETNQAALKLLSTLETSIRHSGDPLKQAIHLAVAGNIIDLGIGHTFDLKKDVTRILKQPFSIDHYTQFRKELRRGRKLLYLADNCGEIVFDRVLVKQLLVTYGLQVTVVVKSGPIINDATREDAAFAGITALCPVIETGSNDIGVGWANVSSTFRRHVRAADLILAKGHGNFETCIGKRGNYYFLLKAKCDIVASELGVKTGDTVFKHMQRL